MSQEMGLAGPRSPTTVRGVFRVAEEQIKRDPRLGSKVPKGRVP